MGTLTGSCSLSVLRGRPSATCSACTTMERKIGAGVSSANPSLTSPLTLAPGLGMLTTLTRHLCTSAPLGPVSSQGWKVNTTIITRIGGGATSAVQHRGAVTTTATSPPSSTTLTSPWTTLCRTDIWWQGWSLRTTITAKIEGGGFSCASCRGAETGRSSFADLKLAILKQIETLLTCLLFFSLHKYERNTSPKTLNDLRP